MSNSYSTAELETRIRKLENSVQKLNEVSEQLGLIATTNGHQALFVNPLQAFFEAPEFWEIVIPDNSSCHNACIREWRLARARLLAELMTECIENNSERFEEINNRLLECRSNCGSLFPGL